MDVILILSINMDLQHQLGLNGVPPAAEAEEIMVMLTVHTVMAKAAAVVQDITAKAQTASTIGIPLLKVVVEDLEEPTAVTVGMLMGDAEDILVVEVAALVLLTLIVVIITITLAPPNKTAMVDMELVV
jgi:hypothetical protein